MYIRHLEIDNLRGIAKARLDFVHPTDIEIGLAADLQPPPRIPNVTLLLGVNGAGKSTVLDAVALAILSPIIGQSGYRPYSLIRRVERGRIPEAARIAVNLKIHGQDTRTATGSGVFDRSTSTTIERRGDTEQVRGTTTDDTVWEGMFDDTSPAFLLVGYGATRRVEATSAIDSANRSRLRQLRYERVASLFEDHFTLRPLASWLPAWEKENPGRHKQVVNLINKLSGEAVKFTGELEKGEYLFKTRNAKVPFSALSDGYKAFIGWVGDLLYHVCMGCPSGLKLVDNKGVVLVDEIDLHIHPEWQRTIIPTLARTLPNLQFIFTSHSPLVVGTLERANIVHVEAGRGGKPVFRRPDEETYGLSADQILRSGVFGLDSTRDPGFKDHLDRLSAEAASGNEASAMRFMREVAVGSAAKMPERESAGPPAWVTRLSALRTAE